MILIADSRLAAVHCRQTVGLVWSNELLMGGKESRPTVSTLHHCTATTTHTGHPAAAHFINIKPEKQAKNVEIVQDACPVTQTEKFGANILG